MLLTACGTGQTQEESEMPDEHEITESGSGTAGTKSGTEERAESAYTADHKYEKITVSYSEAVEGFSFRKDMEKTQTDYAVYYFDASIDNRERNACIEATDRMLSCIDAARPAPEIVVLEEEFYDGVSVSGNRLYLSPQPWDSVDYLAKVLLAGYGEWGNYGLAYGYADYLCQKAGLDNGEKNPAVQDTGSLLTVSAPELYDLNLLCFDEKFVTSEDVEASKNNARLLVADYLSSHSEAEFLELLSASGTEEGMEQAKEAMEAFYTEKGVECDLTEIRYQLGGVAFDYGAACQYARFYIMKDWQDETWEENPMVSERFLHEDYEEVREFFECNSQQMRQYQEFFDFDSYNNDLPILFTNNTQIRGAGVSYYLCDKHTIHVKSVVDLMHEYIHSVTYGHIEWDTLWKIEGLAYYFSTQYNLYAYDYLNNTWNGESMKWVQEYIAAIGRPIDIQTDSHELSNILVHARGYKDPNSSYGAGASFIGYLAEQYGEQAVIAYICSDSEYNAEWCKSYEELVQDWNRYIEENYSQYSINAGQ